MAPTNYDWIWTNLERFAYGTINDYAVYDAVSNKFHASRVSKVQYSHRFLATCSPKFFQESHKTLPLVPQPTLLMQRNPLPSCRGPHRTLPLTHPHTTSNPPLNHLITLRTLDSPRIHIRPDHFEGILEVMLSRSNREPVFYGGAETWDAGGDFDVVDGGSEGAVGVDLKFEGSGDDAVCYL